MKQINFKQEKPTTVVILGVLLVLFSIFSANDLKSFIFLLSIGLLLLGYRVSFKIAKDYNNKKVFSIFKVPLIITKLNILFPDYISLFGANFSKRNDWGTVSAIGTNSNADKIVIRLFKGSEKFTVYKSNKYEKSKELAEQLSRMLKVELVDNVNE